MSDLSKIKKFLSKISQLESSGGTNLRHAPVSYGIQEGETALGQYGLMPNTIYEMAKRKKMQDILNIPKEGLAEQFTPEMEERVANALARRVLQKSGGSEDAAAYRWNMGHNLPPERVMPETLDQSDYVQKFRMLQKMFGSK